MPPESNPSQILALIAIRQPRPLPFVVLGMVFCAGFTLGFWGGDLLPGRQAERARLAINEINEAKQSFYLHVYAGELSMPVGYNLDSLEKYTPNFREISPFIDLTEEQKADWRPHAPFPIENLTTGTGGRTFQINAIDTSATCQPCVPAAR